MIPIQHAIDQAGIDGVSHPENFPFYFAPAESSSAGVLLVHGFTASPREMLSLARHLNALGFHCLGVRLPGHGTRAEDLATRRLEDWQQAVLQGHERLRPLCSRIYGIGLSTGALLCLDLASRTELSGLVLMAPFLKIRNRFSALAGLAHRFIPYHNRPLPETLAPYYYEDRPVYGIHQINRLCRRLSKKLPDIHTPCLSMLSLGDATVCYQSGLKLFERLGSARKQCHIFGPDAPHTLCTDQSPVQSEVFRLCTGFLMVQEESPPAPGASRDA